ncbi:hypothetical protein V8E36_001743 [Tilletia maclaganii]
MSPSSASLTTFFVVGPEEYVEFAESMGSKAFLQHIWDNAVTPLSQREIHSTPRLHNSGARVVRPADGPPRIEFPTVKRIRGNRYKPTGKWISWQALKRLNPIAVNDPPDLDVFLARGGQVGSGERRAPGAYLEQTSSKNQIPFAVPEEEGAEGTAFPVTGDDNDVTVSQSYESGAAAGSDADPTSPTSPSTGAPPSKRTIKPSLNVDSQGWIGLGSAQSIHAPARAVVVRRTRQTSSPAALAAKAALAAGRPGPSPLSNSTVVDSGGGGPGANVGTATATVTPANAHLLSRAGPNAAAALTPAGPAAAAAARAYGSPKGTPPAAAHAAARFSSHAPSSSISGALPYSAAVQNTPPPSRQRTTSGGGGGAAFGCSPAQSSPGGGLYDSPGSTGSGSSQSRASRRPNLRVPMPPPPQHLSSSFRASGGGGNGNGNGNGGAAASGSVSGTTDLDATSGGAAAAAASSSSSSAAAAAGGGALMMTPGGLLTPGHAAGARTPLSATHPPPETPLKHQRRRAKETAALAAAVAVAVGPGAGKEGGGPAGGGGRQGDGARTDKGGLSAMAPSFQVSKASASTSAQTLSRTAAGDGYIDADDERDPMDFAAQRPPLSTGADGSGSSSGPESDSRSSSGETVTAGALTGGPELGMSSITGTGSSPPAGLAGPGGLGGGAAGATWTGPGAFSPPTTGRSGSNTPPDLRGLASLLNRADAERTRLAFERTAAGQDPLLSASANARPPPVNGVPPPSVMWGSGGGGGGGSAGGGGFGAWSGLGDWAVAAAAGTGTGMGTTSAAAVAAAIADARRSSLPPLTPATESAPYAGAMNMSASPRAGYTPSGGGSGGGSGSGTVATSPGRSSGAENGDEDLALSGIGLGLETGPPVGRPSRPSVFFGGLLDAPPPNAGPPRTRHVHLSGGNGRAAASGTGTGKRRPDQNSNASSTTDESGSATPIRVGGNRRGRDEERAGTNQAGSRSNSNSNSSEGGDSDDLAGGGPPAGGSSSSSLHRQESDQGSSLASSFQFVRLGAGLGPSTTATLAQVSASSSPERERERRAAPVRNGLET